MSGGKPGSGRRKHQRVRAKGLNALVGVEPELDCPVEDLSRGGVFLKTDRPIPIGTLVPVELKQGGKRVVQLKGWIVRQVPGPDTPPDATPGLGVVFDQVDGEAEEKLGDLMASTGIMEAVAAPPPLPLQNRRSGVEPAAVPEVPTRGPRFEGDPFGERPEPRMPRGGLPDEKVEFFRAVLVGKDEALTRGRRVYAEAVAEAEALHELASNLRQQLTASLTQIEQGRTAARELGVMQAKASQLESELTAKQSVLDAILVSRSDLERRVAKNELEMALLREEARNAEASLQATLAQTEKAEAKLAKRLDEAERAMESERQYRKEAASQLLELESAANNIRKLRDELGAANKKAMEAQVALNKERRAKEDLDAKLAQSEKSAGQLGADCEKLKADAATLKRKLMAAEDALEAAATRRARKPAKPA